MDRVRRSAAVLAVLAAAAQVTVARAEVVSAVASEQSHGQAYTFRLPEGCFAALPAHVVALPSGKFTAPMLRSRTGREAEGLEPIRPDPTLDLVFVRVAGALAAPCGSADNLGVDSLEYQLRTESDYRLRVSRGQSSMQQIPLRLVRTNRRFLFFAPAGGQPVDELMQSMSGGVVLAGEQPVGMLLSVNVSDGLAEALRFDVIKQIARATLTGKANPASAPGTPRSAFEVAAWEGESVDATAPASAVLKGGAWRVRPVARRATLILAAGGVQPVSRIVVARSPSGADRQPDLLTVWTAVTADGEWVLVRTCSRSTAGDGPLFDCGIAAREAGAVKLEFGTRESGGVMTIGAVALR